jgi:hypothetical protein
MRWLTLTLVVTGAAALVGFAGAAQASATIDLVWIDTTDPACIDAARRDCPQLGTEISSVAATDNITLAVIVTAGPKGIQAASVGVDYRDALPKLSVTDFRSLSTTEPLPYLPIEIFPASNEPAGWVQNINAVCCGALAGIGLPAGNTAYLGTVTFHKAAIVNGFFEISVGANSPNGVDAVLALDPLGENITETTTFNSAFLTNVACDAFCSLDKKCSVGGGEPQDSCVARSGDQVTYHYAVEVFGGSAVVIDDKLGVIGTTPSGTLTKTTTISETTTNNAWLEVADCFCIAGEGHDTVTVTVSTPTPGGPTATPTAIPTVPSYSIANAPSDVQAGAEFTVDLILDLGSYSSIGHEVSVSFTPGVLVATDAIELGAPPYQFHLTPGVRNIDNAAGVVEQFEAVTLGDPIPPQAPFVVGRITFRAGDVGGATIIGFFHLGGALLDGGNPAQPIEGVVFNGAIVNVIAAPTATPTATPTASPTPGAFDCLCEVQNINPNQVVLQNVGTGGKGANSTRKMVVILHAVDAPGASCDPGEFSAPTPVNLKMEDDGGNILIDSAKTVVCGQGGATILKREVFFQGPLNCENGAVPASKPGFSLGTITSTGSASGTADYVESTNIKCFE